MDDMMDTFLVAVYTVVDDIYLEEFAPLRAGRPGARPVMADSEVLTLLVLGQMLGMQSERGLVRHADRYWRACFPRQLSQSAFNRRGNYLAGPLAALGPLVSARVSALVGEAATHEVLDGVAVPLARRCRGGRRRLFGADADIGKGGPDKDWYYGVKLLVAITPTGAISGFVAGPASTEERWLAEALFRWRRDPAALQPTAEQLLPLLGASHRTGGTRKGPKGTIGPCWGAGRPSAAPMVGDLGYRGTDWQRHWRQTHGVDVLTKGDYASLDPANRRRLSRWLSGLRQRVETAIGRLVDRFGLRFPRARSRQGLWTRLGAKIAAHNIAILLNALAGRPLLINPAPFA